MFALKIINYEKFEELRSSIKGGELHRGVRADEDDGSPSARLSVGSGLTAPRQTQSLACNEITTQCDGGYPATPGSWGLTQFAESLKPNLVRKTVKVKI